MAKMICLFSATQKFRVYNEIANRSDDLANYLGLTFIIDHDNGLSIKLFDNSDDFNFHIVNYTNNQSCSVVYRILDKRKLF